MREISIVPIIETKPATVAHYFCKGRDCKAHKEEATRSPIIGFPTKGVFIKRDCFGHHVIDKTVVTFFNPGQPFEVDHPAGIPDHSWFITLDDPAFAAAWCQFGAEDSFLEGRPFQQSTAGLAPADWVKAAKFYQLIQENPDGLALQENVFALLDWILPKPFKNKPKENIKFKRKKDRINAAKVYLAENFRENVQLADLAKATGTSPYHLCRLFRAETGNTLHEQLIRLRLRTALEDLHGGHRSVTSIALDLGFNSPSHFSTCFKKYFGQTPTFYRESFV